jgi:oligopeptide/dipeptide ABC transporter ATP-binding protein
MPPIPLHIQNLHVYYGEFEAVRDVSLEVRAGQVLGLIGETGSGKSSVALAAARLLPPKARITGTIHLDGTDIAALDRSGVQPFRGSTVGFVSQDAMAALNPVLTVGRQVAEMFEVHDGATRSDAMEKAIQVMRTVRISDPEAVAKIYPHQLSGGMRQRIMIAIAIALKPRLIIADEPTTGLDVSVQAEILALIAGLKQDLGAGILWISHDMGVIAELADQVAVMYAGRIVERASADDLFDAPRHPYTQALVQTLYDLRRGNPGEPLFQIGGQPPSRESEISGCRFHPRCPRATPRCEEDEPDLRAIGDSVAACHFPLVGAEAG